jgi:hypothetical protein
VYTGGVVHLDCILDRRRGTPQWGWSHNYRDYATGWLADEPDRNWKFRLSLVYTKIQVLSAGPSSLRDPDTEQSLYLADIKLETGPSLLRFPDREKGLVHSDIHAFFI